MEIGYEKFVCGRLDGVDKVWLQLDGVDKVWLQLNVVDQVWLQLNVVDKVSLELDGVDKVLANDVETIGYLVSGVEVNGVCGCFAVMKVCGVEGDGLE
uniref:Uncharacterized protein n=1 Tax=Acrobeloides nanus TaxID=290746 RepID=A0A914DD79_9BILA